MKPIFQKTAKILGKLPLPLILLSVFLLGYLFKGEVASESFGPKTEVSEEAEAEIWTCSMHPQIRLPKSGQCPICGMDLIFVEGATKPTKPAKSTRRPKYACSMFCVPPLPNPGNCPICGMEMVKIEEDEGGAEAGERTLTLTPNAQKLAAIQTVPVERKFVSAEIRMVGKIDYDETRLGYLTAWVPGRLDRLYVDYTGVPVKKGEHLVYLYSPELLTAQEELLQAIRAIGDLEDSNVESIRGTAQEWVEDIREKLRLWGLTAEQIREIEQRGTPTDHITIYAPMGGIVIHKNAIEGMYVQTGTRIYTIADLSHVWLKLDAYESDLAWLRYGQEVEFLTEAYPGETFTGTVAFIDPVLNSKTRTVKIRVNVDNADGRLKPEMFVRAIVRAKIAVGGRIVNAELADKWICPMHPEVIEDSLGTCDMCGMPLVRAESLGFVSVESGNVEPPLVIPVSAPLITGKRALVYVEKAGKPGTYQGREIILGPRAGDHYIVYKGLDEGERVVVNGNFKIDSAIQIRGELSMMKPGDAPETIEDNEAAMPQPRRDLEGGTGKNFEIDEAFRVQLEPVFAAYFRIREHLSHDLLSESQEAAGQLGKAIDGIEMGLLKGRAHEVWMKEAKGMTKTANGIGDAVSIEKARLNFALLSETMIVVAKQFGTGGQPAYRFQCPMAFDGRGADWLQDKDRLGNPFFGSAMFRCGVSKETIGKAPVSQPTGGSADE